MGDEERVVFLLEFFSYYFLKIWDEKIVRVVLFCFLEYFENDGMCFDVFFMFDVLVGFVFVEKVFLFGLFVEKLKEIKKIVLFDE